MLKKRPQRGSLSLFYYCRISIAHTQRYSIGSNLIQNNYTNHINKDHNITSFQFRSLNHSHNILNSKEGTALSKQIRNYMTETEDFNHLSDSQSPYLLQHKDDPLHWYPWGEEAFQKARKENRPIFLSIGYSCCHWCHVMHQESFKNKDIAWYLNKHFVSIKVDREERPDVDRVYMAFVQATTGGGGWPLSVFLTPDLKPIFGGTYFPPHDKYNVPGFETILQKVVKLWKDNKEEIESQSHKIMELLQQREGKSSGSNDILNHPDKYLKLGAMQELRQFDDKFGGYGDAPKFPRPSILNMMFRAYHMFRSTDSEMDVFAKRVLHSCIFTLEKMAYGGLRDHVDGGFHRYSVDEQWHIPHFEKMLYDQAQLVHSYLDGWAITKNKLFKEIVDETLGYVCKCMTNGKAFYSAEDADSKIKSDDDHGIEGAYYVFSFEDLKNSIPDENSLKCFMYIYDCYVNGNVPPRCDPQGELKGKNHLIQRKTFEDAAKKFEITADSVKTIVDDCMMKLRKCRESRLRPHLDDKILVSWNGLMLGAFARSGATFGTLEYINTAEKCAQFLYDVLYHKDTGTLMHSYRSSVAPIEGFLNDYAFLIDGLLHLYEATGKVKWLEFADKLQVKQNELFWDEDDKGFFDNTQKDPSILLKTKENYDGAEPAGNSVAAMNLVRLATILDKEEYTQYAEDTLSQNEYLMKAPHASPQAACALHQLTHPSKQYAIVLPDSKADLTSCIDYLQVIHSSFDPAKTILLKDEFTSKTHPYLANAISIDDQPTAYICEYGSCQPPISNLEELKKQIENST